MIAPMFLILLLTVTVFFLIRAEFSDQRRQIYFLKPSATLLVIGIAALALLQPGVNTSYTQFILVGLLFSLGGDMALMFPKNRKYFSIGLGLFLTAHIVYTVAFFKMGELTVWSILPIAIMSIFGISFYRVISEKLESMKIPVITYIIIISIMVVSAAMVLKSSEVGKSQAFMMLAGACLFYTSDIILAANRFWREWKYNRISLAFYYSGQLLIALAASYTNWTS